MRRQVKELFTMFLVSVAVSSPIILDACIGYVETYGSSKEIIQSDMTQDCTDYSSENDLFIQDDDLCESVEYETVQLIATAYCPCERCCGSSTGITFSGTVATEGRTIGANLNHFPIGTVLEIDGIEYVVEDTGNLGFDVIDVFMNSHEEALIYGVRNVEAIIKK